MTLQMTGPAPRGDRPEDHQLAAAKPLTDVPTIPPDEDAPAYRQLTREEAERLTQRIGLKLSTLAGTYESVVAS